jgi:hypothetical protein
VFASVAAAAAPEQSTTICLDDRVGVDHRARAAFGDELRALADSGIRFSETACVRIVFRAHAPSRYAAALGLTYSASGRVLPVIEVYTRNIVKALAEHAGSERFGRALARVAFHELQHYTRQEHGHDSQGLFARALNASALLH